MSKKSKASAIVMPMPAPIPEKEEEVKLDEVEVNPPQEAAPEDIEEAQDVVNEMVEPLESASQVKPSPSQIS